MLKSTNFESRGAAAQVLAGSHDALRARCRIPRCPRRRRRHVAHHAGRQRHAGGPAADGARGLRQADVHQLPGQRLGEGPHGGRDRRQPERGCQHLALGGGYGFEQTVLGGAHFAVAAFLPYTWLSISGNSAALGGVQIQNSVSGIGDLTVVPVMLAWKADNWQYDFLMPVYAPTGSYEVGRLGNTGLNYWTFDPIVGVAYSNAKSGLNAAVHLGYAINTENNDTSYKSGDILHFDASMQQIFPLGSGFANIGAEAWYFQQVTCDSGSGATLGCFKGRTAGIGPVLGYIQPIGKEKLLFEFKWLPELETKNRLNGDYIWLKMVYTF